jgi:hypothetical protein
MQREHNKTYILRTFYQHATDSITIDGPSAVRHQCNITYGDVMGRSSLNPNWRVPCEGRITTSHLLINMNTPAPQVLCASISRSNHRFTYTSHTKKINIIAIRQMKVKASHGHTYGSSCIGMFQQSFQRR